MPERHGGADSAVAPRARAGLEGGAGAFVGACRDSLRSRAAAGTIGVCRDEATQLMLEALFDIRTRVKEIHEVVVEPEDDDEETEEDR